MLTEKRITAASVRLSITETWTKEKCLKENNLKQLKIIIFVLSILNGLETNGQTSDNFKIKNVIIDSTGNLKWSIFMTNTKPPFCVASRYVAFNKASRL